MKKKFKPDVQVVALIVVIVVILILFLMILFLSARLNELEETLWTPTLLLLLLLR